MHKFAYFRPFRVNATVPIRLVDSDGTPPDRLTNADGNAYVVLETGNTIIFEAVAAVDILDTDFLF